MDNRTLQNDEVEALSAIYGKEWIKEDCEGSVYSISLKADLNEAVERSDRMIKIQFRLSPDYPLTAPPFYELSAPWMTADNKLLLKSCLDEVYFKHAGESILYLMVEKAREFLIDEDADETCQLKSSENTETSQSYTNEDEDSGANDYHQHHYHHHHHHSSDHNNEPIFYHGEPIVDRRSTFQAHLSPVHCIEEAQKSLAALKANKRISTATHNISAYRISGGPHNTFLQDCDDDGESHAGSRLLHLLQILDAKNVLVVVSRWFGGIQLGPDRFKHINNAARDLLQKCGYIDNHEEETNQNTKGKKKSK